MRYGLLALALLAALACQGAPSQVTDDPATFGDTVGEALCRLGFTAIALREMPTGHHLVEAELNGHRGTFVLDTGANVSVLNAGFAHQFGVEGRPLASGRAAGLGAAANASQVGIEQLSIDGTPIRQDDIVLADLSQLTGLLASLAGTTVHGIIGQDVMKAHRAVIDVSGPTLYLIAEDRDPAPVLAARCRDRAAESGAKAPGTS